MDHLSVRDAAYFEQVSEGSKTKNAGYTIAWILAAIFILAILFWVFNRSSCNHNEANYRAADHNANTRERIGILEGQMMSVGKVLDRVVPELNELGRFTSAQLGGLVEYTKCADKGFASLQTQVYKLDDAVFASRCGDGRFGGCGEGRGGRRFAETSTYAPVSSAVTVTETCRN